MTSFKNFTNTGILDPLFTCLWIVSTDFVLIQVNIGSDTYTTISYLVCAEVNDL